MNVLRDTHSALVPGGLLLDFHPIAPPWPRVVSRSKTLGVLENPDFLPQLRATEGGLAELVRRRLLRPIAARSHDIAEHYENGTEALDGWGEDDAWLAPDLQARLRETTEPVQIVERLVFHLYQVV